ncbi:MAG: outer membrane protein assembly factor BamE [Verrucomicrobiota bacterium]
MKSMKHIALVASLALLVGCATTFRPWLLSEIEEGMERAQVVRILGEPDFAEMKNGAEFLHYSYRENHNPSISSDLSDPHYDLDRNAWKKKVQRTLKEYRYAVKLVEGKVQSYKELLD